MTVSSPTLLRILGAISPVLLAFMGLMAFSAPASAQLTGGLEGIIIHHTFERATKVGASEVVAEAWLDRKTGDLWVRGRMAPEALKGTLTMRSQVAAGGPPADARRLSPKVVPVDAPTWLERGHLWARPEDGVVGTAVKLTLTPGCDRRCAVVGVEHYELPGGAMSGSGFSKLHEVDLWPVEPGDVRTVYAER